MLLSTIARPLIGAVIGYCTNFIAVKMLFRPFFPVKLFGHTLPFTPGVIPKEQGRVAKAVGGVIARDLLDENTLEQTLLNEDTKQAVHRKVEDWLREQQDNPAELGEMLCGLTGEDSYARGRETVYRDVTDRITGRVEQLELGGVIAGQVVAAVKEKVSGTLLAMMVNDELLASFSQPIADKIDDYIAVHGEELLAPVVCEELDRLEHTTAGAAVQYLSDSGLDLPELAVGLYDRLVRGQLRSALHAMDLAGIVERKIMSMSPKELEQLVMSVMKKELSAVVNLGALIGFLLGLLNLLF